MAAVLETPSRIWRRIEAIEGRDMPSLPSLPAFEDSAEEEEHSLSRILENDNDDQFEQDLQSVSSPIHSTPAASTHNTVISAYRAQSSTSSTARFANSIASRSVKSFGQSSSRGGSTRRSQQDSFDISDIPSLPHIQPEPGNARYSDDSDEEESKVSVPDVYLPPPEEEEDFPAQRELSLTEALQSISREGSPSFPLDNLDHEGTPKKQYDYSVSLKSEPKASPFDKYRNVALRKTAARTRTPSLSRTTSSEATSPGASTPRSNKSAGASWSDAGSHLSATSPPRSTTTSPRHRLTEDITSPLDHGHSNESRDAGMRSMDITDIHISPPRPEDERTQEVGDEHQHHGSQGSPEREPTFSSDGDPTPYASKNSGDPGSFPANSPSAFSSPAQSIAFTPTPAFPRPRARFDLPPPPADLLSTPAPREEGNEHGDEEDLMTPHTRRRSFLLSVINSTARPRMKFPTPHPRHLQSTPSVAESTPAAGSSSSSGSGTNLQTAFAGVTPRPRMPAGRRASHPLSQAISASASPGTSDSESSAGPAGSGLAPWATPAHFSPYDGTVDRASFISTASSHDLTTHHRVNTSFDPAMGFGAGAPGHGVGRFNAGKLNNYLHGLNRRLQEENEALLARLRKLEAEKKIEEIVPADPGRRLSGGSSRRSSVGTTLGNVQEDMAEGWLEEKAELEDMVDAFKEEVTKCMMEKEEIERELEKEKEERERDKERWRERMAEVEEGVSGIIAGLEQKLEASEKRAKETEEETRRHIKELEKESGEIRGERDVAVDRASKAERLLESGKELGGALKEANERVGQIMSDLRNANAQIKELEEEVMQSDARIDELEKEAKEDKDVISSLEDELNTQSDAVASERAKSKQLEDIIRQVEEELGATKAYANELEEGASAAVEQIETLEDELASARQMVQSLKNAEEQASLQMKDLEEDAEKAQELARQMEEALEEAERKMLADEEALADLKIKVESLEREKQRLASNVTQDISRTPAEAGPSEEDLEALENELDDANKEIARLQTLLEQSPARKAMEKAKDTKIEMLEREKEELLERNKALRMTFNEMNTPSKVFNASGISPIHRQVLAMSIKAPRTPGAPLRDISWLNNTTSDPSVSPLVAEIGRLQRELDLANESIDDKLDKLEDAGLGVVGLTKKLEDARSKISRLEDEIARLSRKEERYMRRFSRTRCQKCNIKLDLRRLTQADESSMDISRDNLPAEPPTPPTRTSEALRADVKSLNSHLDGLKRQWEEEKKQLLGEKAVLQDAATRLNVQVKNAKEEARKAAETARGGDRAKANVQSELEHAKQTISELEAALGSERSQLRSLTTEQDRMAREKKQVMTQLQRTQSDMDDVRQQLQRFKQENLELETELRENINAEQKARLLEKRVAENTETIAQLRQERSLLAADHKDLQRRYSEISETANKLREEHATHLTTHDNRRHQLDLQLLEIEDLRHALEHQTNELQRAEQEKDKIVSEKSDVAKTVAILETDLKRVRRDAEAFGRDLKSLREEKEKAESKLKEELAKNERTKKQTQAQLRLLNEQFDKQKEKTIWAKEELKKHVCAADEHQISAMKLQHNKECKGLMLQIRYLKAKFIRESCFRDGLVYQKKYLLELLAKYEKSERTIFASIARIGFPVAMPPPAAKKAPKLKSVAMMVVFLSRVKHSGDLWREQSSAKQALAAALEDVRRKRATTASS